MHQATHKEIVDAVRAVAAGRTPASIASTAADELGLLQGGELTTPGRALAESALRRDGAATASLFRDAVANHAAVRTFLEGEWGLDLTRQQAEEILQYSYPPSRQWESADFVRLFTNLTAAGLVVYSRKHGTIRVLAGAPSSQPEPRGTMISPSTPYRNKLLLASILKSAATRLWWFDAHLDRKGLRFLYDEASLDRVSEIRILTCGRASIDEAALDDYRRLREELGDRGTAIEWRSLLDREELTDKHDRWIRTDDRWWNVPPHSAVMAGKYGSLLEDHNLPPFDEWWAAGTDVTEITAGAR